MEPHHRDEVEPFELASPVRRRPRALRARVLGLLLLAALLGPTVAASRDPGPREQNDAEVDTVDDRFDRWNVRAEGGADPATTEDEPETGGGSTSAGEPDPAAAPAEGRSPDSVAPVADDGRQPAGGPHPSTPDPCAVEATDPAYELDWQPPSLPASGTVVYVEWTGTSGSTSRTFTLADSLVQPTSTEGSFRVAVSSNESWYLEFAPDEGPLVCGGWQVVDAPEPPILRVDGLSSGCSPTGPGGFVVDSYDYAGDHFSDIEIRFSREGCGTVMRGYLRYDATDPTRPPPPVSAAGFGWSPPEGATPTTGDFLYVQSSAGDYVGQGATTLYTPANSTFRWTWTPRSLWLRVQGSDTYWDLSAHAPRGHESFMEGWYRDLTRTGSQPALGGIDVSSTHRGCNTVLGQLVIDRFETDLVEGRLEQRCDGDPPLYAAFRDER